MADGIVRLADEFLRYITAEPEEMSKNNAPFGDEKTEGILKPAVVVMWIASIVLGGVAGVLLIAGFVTSGSWLLLFGAVLLCVGIINAVSIIMRFYRASRIKGTLYDKYVRIAKYDWALFPLIFLLPIAFYILFAANRHRKKKYRYGPRVSPKRQLPMHILTESEDDSYLNAGNLLEERINSVDYDVWVTDDREETLVLRYNLSSVYEICPQCGFRTLYLDSSHILEHATYYNSGLRRENYLCENCRHQMTKDRVIPMRVKVDRSSSSFSSFSSGRSRSSSSSGSSHRSSFGGGRSGGGGASGKW
jgi:uncharacterized protein